jgi:hypothetical protein
VPCRRAAAIVGLAVAVALVATAFAPVVVAADPVSAQVLCNPSLEGSPLATVTGGFHAVTPSRVLDTRISTGPVEAGCTAVADLLPYVPPEATGVALDVVAVDAGYDGFVTVYPCDAARPFASNLNPRVGDPTANSVVVPLGSSRRSCLYTSTPTQLVVDITGWFGPGGASFHGTDPARLLDTRDGPRPDGGSGPLPGGSVLALPIAALAPVPADASAVAVNVTATNTGGPGYVTTFPCGTPVPFTSNGNFLANDTRANQSIVGLDGAGKLCIFASVTTDLIVDVTGWFAGTDGTRLAPIVATRVVDSRDGTGGWSGRMVPGVERAFDPTRGGTVAVGANAVLDVVATDATAPGFLRVYPCGGAQPPTSSVNFTPNVVAAANLAVVAVGDNGLVCVASNVPTDVVIDVLGSFGPAGSLRELSVAPGPLVPAFSPDAHDYGVICAAGPNPWQVSAQGVPGATVVVAGADSSGYVTVAENDLVDVAVTVADHTDHYHVRCLPHDFPQLVVSRPDDPSPGWYLLGTGFAGPPDTSYAVILDDHGAPVWYHKTDGPVIGVQRLPDGNLAWTPLLGASFGTDPNGAWEEHTLDGSLVKKWSTVGTPTDHHDMVALPNGNVLLASYHYRANVDVSALGPAFTSPSGVVDAWIQEVRPDGTIAWEWHSEDHIGVAETVAQADGVPITATITQGSVVDLIHLNSIDVDPATGDLLISSRHTDAVYRIRRDPGQPDDGTVLWKLGGDSPTDPATPHLTLIGDALDGPHRQHDARFLPDGHVTMFDDESNRPAPARAVEYAVNAPANTATLVWQYQRPDGQNSFAMGSTRKQPDGSAVIAWGANTPYFTDLEPHGYPTLSVAQAPLGWAYRTIKLPPSAFDPAELRQTAGS